MRKTTLLQVRLRKPPLNVMCFFAGTGSTVVANIQTRCARVLTAFLVVASMCMPFQSAHADVRKSDVIYGQTMESRGIHPVSCPSLGAEYAYVVDQDGVEYFARNADTPTQIASITKVMTAIVALENSTLDRQVVVSKAAASVGESSALLWEGDVLSMEDALKGLMVPSGNDAAIAIADCLGSDFLKQAKEQNTTLRRMDGSALDADNPTHALDAFVVKMNEKAVALGCTNTIFQNPHGLDDGKFAGNLQSTAREVSKICAYAMKNDTFRSLCDLPKADLLVNRGGSTISIEVLATDELLGVYEGACGIKTGKTDLAGPCFAGACRRNGKDLYAIVLHSSSDQQRFADCVTLYDWVYNNQMNYPLAHSSQTAEMMLDGQMQTVPVVAQVALTGWIDKTVPATFANPTATASIFVPHGNVSQQFSFNDISGGISAGQVVGKATFYQHNAEIASVDLIACESVAGPNIIEMVGLWWEKTTRAFSGQPTSAQSVIINETPIILEKD